MNANTTAQTHKERAGAPLRMGHTITVLRGNKRTVIKIRLDDECRNGHADFHMTCDIIEKAENGRWVDVGGGCAHEHILNLRPELKLFADLHLSDFTGAPMYAVENGFYHLHNAGKPRSERLKIAAEHFRCTPGEAERLETAEDKKRLAYMLENMGLPERWQKEADAAIAQLEAWGAPKFDITAAGVSHYVRLSQEDRAKLEDLEKAGYYTPENRAARVRAKDDAEHAAKMTAIIEEYRADVDKATRERDVKLWLCERCHALRQEYPDTVIDEEDAIYYTHSNEVSFNWRGYGKGTSPEAFELFRAGITPADLETLPVGITFTRKTR